MTASPDIFKGVGVSHERDEKARRAVKAFRALQPTLSAYARVLTKRQDVRVEMAAQDNGSTDGHRIFYRPPMALGDDTPHDRAKCDKRDKTTRQQTCPACKIREEVLVVIYHEIAHIVWDSFAETDEDDKVALIREAIAATGGKYAKEIAKRVESAPAYIRQSYMGLAGLVSEWLPFLVNCLEDARVNRELFNARKGTKAMFDALVVRIFEEGVEFRDNDGEVKVRKWSENPVNAQALIGVYCIASGYTYKDWFDSGVEEALGDPELNNLINRIHTIRSAKGVFHLAFPVLARLRELGYCKLPEDPEDEQPQPDGESEEKSDDPGTGTSEDQQDQDGEGDSNDDPSSDSVPSESSSGDDSQHSDPDSESGTGEEPDSGVSSDGESGLEEQEDEAGDAGSSGDNSTGAEQTSQGDSDSSEEGDSDNDESGDSSSVGESGVPEEMDGSSSQEEQESGDTDDSGSAGNPGSDPSSEADPSVPQQTAESNQGSGDIEGDRLDGEREERDSDPEDEQGSPGPGDGSAGDSEHRPSESEDSSPVRDSGDGADPGSDESGDPLGRPDSERGDGDDSERPQEDRKSSERPGTDPPDVEADDEPIDTGADKGEGGTEVIEDSTNDDLPMGEPEEVKTYILKWGDHEEKPKTLAEQKADKADERAIDRAIIQGLYFETPSRNVWGVREHHYGRDIIINGTNLSQAWDHSYLTSYGYSRASIGVEGDFHCPEAVLGPALLRMRVAFSDNARGAHQRNLRAGKINTRALGKRAPQGDDRLFRRRQLPGKKNYFVLIGIDVSGSTTGKNIQLEKRAVMAQAELCHRMGIKFAVYAHSGNLHDPTSGRSAGVDLDIYHIKDPDEPWTDKIQERLQNIGPDSANLDGHTLEYYRKILDRVDATDKIILYYTDGKMPAENHDEELEILQREIRVCAQKGYTLLGVGIRTDSPVRHGLDTVQVDDDRDIVAVVKHLEKRLLATASR